MTTYILDAIGIAHVCDEAEVLTLCGSPVETIACEYVSSADVEDLCPECATEPSAWFADGYSVGAYGTPVPAGIADLGPAERDEYERGVEAGRAAAGVTDEDAAEDAVESAYWAAMDAQQYDA